MLMRKLFRRVSFTQAIGCRAYGTGMVPDIGQPTPASHSQKKKVAGSAPREEFGHPAAAPVKMMTDVVPYTFRQDADYSYSLAANNLEVWQMLFGKGKLRELMQHWKYSKLIGPIQCEIEGGKVDGLFEVNMSITLSLYASFNLMKILNISTFLAGKILPDMIRGSCKLFHNVHTAIPAYLDLEAFQKAAYHGKALLQTMFHSKTYPYESMLSTKVEYECRMRGAQRMAFNPVVGGGPNGSVIHYSRNDQTLKDGDLVLMDVGCELHGYVSDLTRTYHPMEELYDLILQTNKESVKLCKPGASIHKFITTRLKCWKGLKEIGILKDGGSSLYHQLNPTSIGHYVGMDVHDCSMVSYDRPLKPGIVITIEPGVYISSSFDGPERYRGIGIRIEDEVLITGTGYEVLTGSMPKEIKQIESLLNNFCHGMGGRAIIV
ncbi:hypothetical protein FNV43_RR03517 [Rhamnella rubrinervis]|uniref:Peptidase M24 domain-containing protein n=1 Tax=Rhamnella rubrinervis TaxID=2594499 RepID=A0A8K0MPD7_9ROSA|nr:hypothetical protein FNV43_RR03517 [Rhamnella rubrinervis]